MSHLVDYDERIANYDGLPMANVRWHPHGARRHWTAVALVDTGAEYLHLPVEAAQWVGVDLSDSPSVALLTVGGLTRMLHATADVEIEGVRVTVACNFARNATPLVGRRAMFAVLDSLGFSPTSWLARWKDPRSPRQAGVPFEMMRWRR